MIVWLSGVVRPELGGRDDVGVILTPKSGRRLEVVRGFRHWAADNGCYAQGERFDLGRFLAWLDRMAPARASCLFAVAPDVPGDMAATLARSLPVLPELRRRGYRSALAAQNGAEAMPLPWDEFDCLFVGGLPVRDDRGREVEWKLTEAAWRLAAEAKQRGKWVHMGRCNSLARLSACRTGGYDSADGSFLVRAPSLNIPRMERWLDHLRRQPCLSLVADRLGRDGIGIEVNTEYQAMSRDRVYNDAPLFASVEVG